MITQGHESRQNVDPILTELAREYKNAEFSTEHIFPVVEVDKSHGKIPTFGKELFLIGDTERAINADSNTGQPETIETEAFKLPGHDWQLPVDLEEDDLMYDAEQYRTRMCQEIIDLGREVRTSAVIQNLDNYPAENKITYTDDYMNETAVDPLEEIDNYMDDLGIICGKDPNVMHIDKIAYKHLKKHPAIKRYLGLQTTGDETVMQSRITAQKLAELLGLEKVVIGNSRYSADALAFTRIWTNYIWLGYVSTEVGSIDNPIVPSFGYCLRMKGYPYVDTYERNGGKIKMIRNNDRYMLKVANNEFGYLIKNPIDPSVYAA